MSSDQAVQARIRCQREDAQTDYHAFLTQILCKLSNVQLYISTEIRTVCEFHMFVSRSAQEGWLKANTTVHWKVKVKAITCNNSRHTCDIATANL
jgi:hypothetical protein